MWAFRSCRWSRRRLIFSALFRAKAPACIPDGRSAGVLRIYSQLREIVLTPPAASPWVGVAFDRPGEKLVRRSNGHNSCVVTIASMITTTLREMPMRPRSGALCDSQLVSIPF